MIREIEREIVVAVIFSKDDKIFLAKHKDGGVYFGSWLIPGGGIEQGESRKEAVMREVKEETGIDISNYKIDFINDTGKGEAEKTLNTGERVLVKMRFYDYKVVINDKMAKDIKVSFEDEFKTYAWVDVKDLKNTKLSPPSEKLFKKLGYI